MTPMMLISIQVGDDTTSELVAMTPGDAAALLDALKTCRMLMPGEVAQRLGTVISSMQGLDVMPSPEQLWAEPPPAEMDMTPPAPEPVPAQPHKKPHRKGK